MENKELVENIVNNSTCDAELKEDIKQLMKYVKYYVWIRQGAAIVSVLLLLINAIALFSVSKGINHMLYHAFDCCCYIF